MLPFRSKMSEHLIPAPEGAEPQETRKLMEPGEHVLEILYADDQDGDGKPLLTRAGDPRIKIKVINEEGVGFYHFLYLTPKAYPIVWEFLSACGFEPENGEFILDPQILVGRRFKATVYVEDGWNRLKKPTPMPREKPEPEQAKPNHTSFFTESEEDDDVPW